MDKPNKIWWFVLSEFAGVRILRVDPVPMDPREHGEGYWFCPGYGALREGYDIFPTMAKAKDVARARINNRIEILQANLLALTDRKEVES